MRKGRRQRTATGRVGRVALAGTVSAALAAATVAPVLGQDEGGLRMRLGLTSSLRVSDNADLVADPDGGSVVSETRLSFGFESVTRTHALRLSVADWLSFGAGPDAPVNDSFDAPSLSLSYQRRTPSSRLDLSAALDRGNLDDQLTAGEAGSSTDLVADQGTLTTRRLGLSFETGLDGPVGTEVSISETDRDYQGTTDPDLFDSTTLAASASLILRPDSATEATLSFSRSDYSAEDAQRTQRITESVSLGASRRIDSVTTVSARLGFTGISETWRAVGLSLAREEGISAGLSFDHEVPDGHWAASFSQGVTSAGPRTDVSVERRFTLPAGKLAISLGGTDVGGDTLQPTGRLDLTLDRADRRLSMGLASRVAVNAESEVERLTTADIALRIDVSPIDRFRLAADIAWVEDGDGGHVTDRTRATATASYARDVTRDWSDVDRVQTPRDERRRGGGPQFEHGVRDPQP